MITQAERRAWQFIQEFIETNHYSPTTSEIAQGLGIKSRGVAYRYLKALANEGLIKLVPNRHRNIELISSPSPQHLRLIGALAAGLPLEIKAEEQINLLNKLVGLNRYALRVKGPSLLDEGIHDGDIVVCERVSSVPDGTRVLAIIDSKHAILRRFFRGPNNTVTLKSVNQNLQEAIYTAQRVEIHGLFVGLLRF